MNNSTREWDIITRRLTRIQEANVLLECWQYGKLPTSTRYDKTSEEKCYGKKTCYNRYTYHPCTTP